ncbi:MAG TPA: TRAP transporter small permease [Candidatus Dormibacteraeota bacterium]
MVLLIEVLARYVFKISLPWPEELARYILVWLTFVGAAVGAAKNRLIVTQVFTTVLPQAVRHWVRVLTTALAIVALAITIWVSQPLFGPAGMTSSPATGIQLRWVFAALPIGGVAIMAFLTRNLVLLLKGREVTSDSEKAALDEYAQTPPRRVVD